MTFRSWQSILKSLNDSIKGRSDRTKFIAQMEESDIIGKGVVAGGYDTFLWTKIQWWRRRLSIAVALPDRDERVKIRDAPLR